MQKLLEEKGHPADVNITFEALESAQQITKTAVSGVTQWSSVYELNNLRANLVFHRRRGDVFTFGFDSGK